jgi:peptidoglycan/LPS O-acetylase OafA/YrhL
MNIPSPQKPAPPQRMATIDTLRFLGAIAVIFIHVTPFYMDEGPALHQKFLGWFLFFVFDFAVPIFLVVAGYLFGKSVARQNLQAVYWKNLKRLLVVFLGWSLIYCLPPLTPEFFQSVRESGLPRAVYWHVKYVLGFVSPWYFLMAGTAAHLWFISALIQAFTLMTIMIGLKQVRAMVYLALVMFALTPLVNLYCQQGLVEHYDWNPMVGPFRATVFVVAGWWLSHKDRLSPRLANTLLVTGFIVYVLEDWLLWKFYGIETPFYEYGRLLMTTGIVMWALIRPNIGANSWMPRLGLYTLGIYCVHPLVIKLFEPYQGSVPSVAWDFILPVVVYAGSLVIAVALSRIPFLKKLAV